MIAVKPGLGVDIGGVIIERVHDGDDTSFFDDRFLYTPEVEDSIDILTHLVQEAFPERLYLISKCGPIIEERTRLWLEHHHFHERTAIPRHHVRFCRRREEKAIHAQELGLTAFVDDRLEVLSYMPYVERRLLFRPDPHEVARFRHALADVIIVESWQRVRAKLMRAAS